MSTRHNLPDLGISGSLDLDSLLEIPSPSQGTKFNVNSEKAYTGAPSWLRPIVPTTTIRQDNLRVERYVVILLLSRANLSA